MKIPIPSSSAWYFQVPVAGSHDQRGAPGTAGAAVLMGVNGITPGASFHDFERAFQREPLLVIRGEGHQRAIAEIEHHREREARGGEIGDHGDIVGDPRACIALLARGLSGLAADLVVFDAAIRVEDVLVGFPACRAVVPGKADGVSGDAVVAAIVGHGVLLRQNRATARVAARSRDWVDRPGLSSRPEFCYAYREWPKPHP